MRSGDLYFLIYDAATTGNITKLKSLLEEANAEHPANGQDKFYNKALQVAAKAGQVDTVLYLLEHGANQQKDKTQWDNIPLRNAASKGHTAVVLALLDYADAQGHEGYIDTPDKCGNTALHDAILGNHAETVACLLAHGANIQVENELKVPLLHIAAYNGHTAVIMAMQAHAISRGDYGYLYTRDAKGKTALHSAASAGHVDTVEYLLEQGMDYRDQNQNGGETPLHEAAINGYTPVVSTLLAHARSQQDKHYLDVRDRRGKTALHHAALYSHSDTVAYLLAQGADYRAQDTSGMMPLYKAAIMGHTLSLVALLTQAKKQHDYDYLHLAHRTGETALHAAASCGRVDAVNYLLAQGADHQCPNNDGETPLQLAIQEGHLPVVRLFCAQDPALPKSYLRTAFEALLRKLEQRPIIHLLDLAKSNLSDQDIARLTETLKPHQERSFHCPRILRLNTNHELTSHSGAYLAELLKKPYPLHELDLSQTRLFCSRNKLMSVLAENSDLETLKLQNCNLGDTDVDTLIQEGLARKDCALRQLDLSDNPSISASKGALFIAAIAGNQGLVLEAIDLQGTGISDQEQTAIKTLVETRLEDWHARVAKSRQERATETAAKLAAASSSKLANQPTEDAFAMPLAP